MINKFYVKMKLMTWAFFKVSLEVMQGPQVQKSLKLWKKVKFQNIWKTLSLRNALTLGVKFEKSFSAIFKSVKRKAKNQDLKNF